MKISRALRRAAGMAVAAVLFPAVPVFAQSYPSKPIRIVLAVPPGGSVDALGRVVGRYLESAVGQPVIIDNRPGGSAKIATDYVAKSAPDGYTLYLMGSSQAMVEAGAIAFDRPRPFDTLRDLTAVATLATNTYALIVHPSLPVKTAAEFVALAKAKPGYISYGSSGVGTSAHVAAALLEQMTKTRMLHVPFKGLGEAVQQLLPGEIQALFSALPVMEPHIRAGKLRLIGPVSADRSFQFPEVPTLAEALPLPGYALETWLGMLAPANTPAAIVNRLNGEFNKMLRDDAFVKKSLHPLGLGAWPRTPDQMTDLLRNELQKYTRLFKELGIKLE